MRRHADSWQYRQAHSSKNQTERTHDRQHSIALNFSGVVNSTLPNEHMTPWFQNARRTLLLASVCVLGTLLLAAGSAGQRDRLAGRDSPALRQAISDAARKYKIPGIAAALIEHGQLRAVEVFGVRDQKSGAPVTPNTIFEAGSLGEPLYAYRFCFLPPAADSIRPRRSLAIFPFPICGISTRHRRSPATEPLYDPRFNQITAIRVMNHTSGMPDWARNQHLRLQLAPGQKWSYSNEGYLYLQRVVEHVTGERFDALVARSIFGPARMSRSSFVWRDADAGEMATGYDRCR